MGFSKCILEGGVYSPSVHLNDNSVKLTRSNSTQSYLPYSTVMYSLVPCVLILSTVTGEGTPDCLLGEITAKEIGT